MSACKPDVTVCMACDFYVPAAGGIETHVLHVARQLSNLGLKVVVATHEYENLRGRHTTPEGIVVYYLPLVLLARQNSLPTGLLSMRLLRDVYRRENVTLVHGHSAYSTLCHEALLAARLLNIPTVYTDHSLLDPDGWPTRMLSRILAFSLSGTSRAICVSQTCRETLLSRTGYSPARVAVIPNAVDTTLFRPALALRSASPTVVVISRLYWRKGIDLLAELIPLVCRAHPTVRFLVGGDGPKKRVLERMCAEHQLQDRVTLLGTVPHDEVPSVLNQGHVFLNCSLTEAFCMALLEAASCGLRVVSSNVGGVHEVLPEDIMTLAPPAAPALAEALLATLARGAAPQPEVQHARLQSMYAWRDVAQRTAVVYADAIADCADGAAPAAAAMRHGGLALGWLLALVVVLARLVLSLGTRPARADAPHSRRAPPVAIREAGRHGGGEAPLKELSLDAFPTLRGGSFSCHASARA